MPAKKLEELSIDELDALHVQIKEDQPAKTRDKLREIKAVRDVKVAEARQKDRVKKILINGAGVNASQVDEWLEKKSEAEIKALIAPFEAIEHQIGTVVTPSNGVLKAEGKEADAS